MRCRVLPDDHFLSFRQAAGNDLRAMLAGQPGDDLHRG